MKRPSDIEIGGWIVDTVRLFGGSVPLAHKVAASFVEAINTPTCPKCGGTGEQDCDDPQCGDSTWDHCCTEGRCSDCKGKGVVAVPTPVGAGDEGETLHTNCHPDPGWIRIGKTCTAGRRSLWVKWEYEPVSDIERRTVAFTLRAGREGDDAEVRVTPENPQWSELQDVISYAEFAAET